MGMLYGFLRKCECEREYKFDTGDRRQGPACAQTALGAEWWLGSLCHAVVGAIKLRQMANINCRGNANCGYLRAECSVSFANLTRFRHKTPKTTPDNGNKEASPCNRPNPGP